MKIVLFIVISIVALVLGRIWYAYDGWLSVVFALGGLFTAYTVFTTGASSPVSSLVVSGGCLALVVGITMLGLDALNKEIKEVPIDKAKYTSCDIYSKCTKVASKNCPSGFDVVARRLEHDEKSDTSTQHLHFNCKGSPPPSKSK